MHASIAFFFGSTLFCVNVVLFLLVLVVGCAVVCCCMTAWAWEWLREGGERGVRRRYGLRFVVAVDDVIQEVCILAVSDTRFLNIRVVLLAVWH